MKQITLLASLALSMAMANAAETEKDIFQFLDHTGWTVSARHELIPTELNNLLDNNVDTYLTLVQPNKTDISLSPEITGITTGDEVYFMIDLQRMTTFDIIYFRNSHTISGPIDGIGVPDNEKVKSFKVYGGEDAEHLELLFDNSAPSSSLVSWPESIHSLPKAVTCQIIKVVLTPHLTTSNFLRVPEFDLGFVKKSIVSNQEDRSSWSLTTTHALVDKTTAENLFDAGTTTTYIALVKAGGKLGSVDLTGDLTAKVGFTVDMGVETEFDYLQIGHRLGQGINLRVAGAIFSGSNDDIEFTTLFDSRRLLVGKAVEQGYYIPMGERKKFRYVKCEYTNWDKNGNTLQVADFNVGTLTSTSIDTPAASLSSVLSSTSVTVGTPIFVKTDTPAVVILRDLSGKTVLNAATNTVETSALRSGIYFITVVAENVNTTTKVVIR